MAGALDSLNIATAAGICAAPAARDAIARPSLSRWAQVNYAQRVQLPFQRGISRRMRNLVAAAGVLLVAWLSAGPIRARAQGQAQPDDTNPRTARFGVCGNSNVTLFDGVYRLVKGQD